MNARYYDSSRGQFVSEDPTFWALKLNLSDPQSLNSYSYSNDNPISKSDPDGLAATVAQQIAVLQAQIRILQGIITLYQGGATQQANTAFAAYQTAFGGGGGSSQNSTQQQSRGSIQTWPSNSSGGTSQVPNITNSLTAKMQGASLDPRIIDPFYFYKKVAHGSWNLKDQPEYDSHVYNMGFIFQGQHVRNDAPANILYGYVGARASGDNVPIVSGPQFLLQEAGAYQIKTNQSRPEWQNSYFHGDDPVDQVNILWGINMFYNR
jgi:hypothetical protein